MGVKQSDKKRTSGTQSAVLIQYLTQDRGFGELRHMIFVPAKTRRKLFTAFVTV
jgi:xanthine dehydrogenase iron-sulfur cluster and FAD-binding subunit A